MGNPFEGRASTLSGPAKDIVPVVPSDTIDMDDVAVALYVETGGALSIETEKGQSRTINLPDAAILPVGVRRVNSSGTTATGIHAFVVT